MTKKNIIYRQNTCSSEDIFCHLKSCDLHFLPKLSSTTDLKEYAEKLYQKTTRFECWEGQKLIGVICFYTNEIDNLYYITNVSVDPAYQGLGIAKNLVKETINNCENTNFKKILLEVNPENKAAMHLYIKEGFQKIENFLNKNYTVILEKKLK